MELLKEFLPAGHVFPPCLANHMFGLHFLCLFVCLFACASTLIMSPMITYWLLMASDAKRSREIKIHRKKYRTSWDLNPRPSEYQSDALITISHSALRTERVVSHILWPGFILDDLMAVLSTSVAAMKLLAFSQLSSITEWFKLCQRTGQKLTLKPSFLHKTVTPYTLAVVLFLFSPIHLHLCYYVIQIRCFFSLQLHIICMQCTCGMTLDFAYEYCNRFRTQWLNGCWGRQRIT